VQAPRPWVRDRRSSRQRRLRRRWDRQRKRDGDDLSAGGAVAFFLAKYDPDGHLFSASYGQGEPQSITSIVTDSQDHPLVLGGFSGGLDFGAELLTSAGESDIDLAKLAMGRDAHAANTAEESMTARGIPDSNRLHEQQRPLGEATSARVLPRLQRPQRPLAPQ